MGKSGSAGGSGKRTGGNAVPRPGPTQRLRLPVATRLASLGGVPSELDQPRLVRMQFQTESREALAEIGEEPLGVLTVLESRQEVVGEPHEHNIPARPAASPLVGP